MIQTRKAIKVSIIGTAGRNEDASLLTRQVWEIMRQIASETILKTWKLDPAHVELVSGGAAGADHVAVRLYLDSRLHNNNHDIAKDVSGNADGALGGKEEKIMTDTTTPTSVTSTSAPLKTAYNSLSIHLPCRWDSKQCRGDDRTSCGKTMNQLHNAFTKKCYSDTGTSSLIELGKVLTPDLGAKAFSHNGFYARNRQVALSDYLIAFTWSDNSLPKAGGTRHTWDMCKLVTGKQKIHFQLKQYSQLCIHITADNTKKRKIENGSTVIDDKPKH